MDSLIYQYTVGGMVFAIGSIYAWRQGYFGTSGNGLRNLSIAIGGFLCFLGVQSYLEYAPMTEAAAVPYDGEPYVSERLGTNLDYGVMIAYFVAMLAIGTWFGRNNKTTKDFFFGGQRFSWWLIAFSLVATTIGSASFVKYSKIAFSEGIASSQTYLNDWFWIPFLLFGWLPILYFSRVVSIPEYFERRFNRTARQIATWLLLAYLIGYVGINLFTMGQALNILLGWDVRVAAAVIAAISAVYVTFGGQTSVIMTDLFQGAMLLATGLLLLFLGMDYLGGPSDFWEHLPRGHRRAFTNFNEDPSYHSVGIFWQDGMANSAMFYFLNQGMVMRLMAARSVEDSRKAIITMLLVLMPIAALVVASGGWVAQAMVHAGLLDPNIEPKEAFFVASDILTRPGIFGLVMAALTAALMSTVDTLVTAISAIVVNDIYKPARPNASDQKLLTVARISALSITILGVLLVPIFMEFNSIYEAHGAFTAAVTPPLVIALLLAVFWRRFTTTAAICTMVGGTTIIFASVIEPSIITPFAHGVPMRDVGEGFLAGKDQYKFMRGFFGLFWCLVIGLSVTLFTKARPLDQVKGLVWGTVKDAIASYKGSPGEEVESEWSEALCLPGGEEQRVGAGLLPVVSISPDLAAFLHAKEHDLLFLSDTRAWLGGLRASHAVIQRVDSELTGLQIRISDALQESLITPGRRHLPIRVKRLY